MADVRPFRALHYDLAQAGELQDLVAPPYDVIDAEGREALVARSAHNAVVVDLPQGDDPYAQAAETFARWQRDGILTRDDEPAFWVLQQDYTGPDGKQRTRTGVFGAVKVEPYGAGRIRPHERTHPGPKEDRLNLTRATRANLSPIFVLHDDPETEVAAAIAATVDGDATFGTTTDDDGTVNRLWRLTEPEAIKRITKALEPAELLIADGHHRYETARVYAEESGTPGAGYVLACLVALQDPGLTIFPTHRLLSGLDDAKRVALREALGRDWELTKIELDELEPPEQTGDDIVLGLLDAGHQQPWRVTLKDTRAADDALPGVSPAYRSLDTAVLEALLLKGALGLTDDDIDHKHGLDYSRTTDEARAKVLDPDDPTMAAVFTGAVPVRLIRDVAAAGEVMPPKSTFFFPKVPTGLVFNPLTEE